MDEHNNTAEIEALIDAQPYYSALYEAESGRNPKAKNPTSSASGGFQFIESTAKALGIRDAFDLAESFEAVQKMTNDHIKYFFTNDPALLYSAHYLGQNVLSRYIKQQPLNEKQQKQVEYLKEIALPRFLKIYERVASKTVEA
jgi:hypothetical protein